MRSKHASIAATASAGVKQRADLLLGEVEGHASGFLMKLITPLVSSTAHCDLFQFGDVLATGRRGKIARA